MNPPIENENAETEDSGSTGLPLLKSWPAVYIFVLSVFTLLVILLYGFTRAYS